MYISKYTNLKEKLNSHSWGAEAKEDINYILGYDYFPKMFNSSTAFLELLILNERELIFKEKCLNNWGKYPEIVTSIKLLKINRKTKTKTVNTLFETDNMRTINNLFTDLKYKFYHNKLNSSKQVMNFLIGEGLISEQQTP